VRRREGRRRRPWAEAVAYVGKAPSARDDRVARLRREQAAAIAILRQLG